jgi:hypothetical protein
MEFPFCRAYGTLNWNGVLILPRTCVRGYRRDVPPGLKIIQDNLPYIFNPACQLPQKRHKLVRSRHL